MSAFEFVVRHLHGLARIPGAAQFFDGALVSWTLLFDRVRLQAIEEVEARALEIPGITLRVHRFGGIGFACKGRELAHIHGNGLLDVFTGKGLARTLIDARQAEPHHLLADSAWVSFWVRRPADVPGAIRLLEAARMAKMSVK